jgi:hypothetical protein
MLSTILFFLLYLAIAVIILEIIFWLLSLIIPTFAINTRIRGLLYAVCFIILLIWALNKSGIGI